VGERLGIDGWRPVERVMNTMREEPAVLEVAERARSAGIRQGRLPVPGHPERDKACLDAARRRTV
jgi:hypothetical protein